MHSRNTVRYYLLIAVTFLFFFFTNDFGLLDVQKTAIVMGIGIDREADTFILTAQIAIPKASEQGGNNAQSAQIESRGKTVAEAYNQINVKTGWYPKLVFCNLIVFGEEAAGRNVFDALDFFLSDRYMSDRCLLTVCRGSAKEILNTRTPVDELSSLAVQKVLSDHAEKVGVALPVTLKKFAVGYFGDGKSGYLPILKIENQQESSSDGGTQNGEENPDGAKNAESGSGGGAQKSDDRTEKVFSAQETALFYDGVMTGELTAEESFAFAMTENKLRLAPYSVGTESARYTLRVRRNKPSVDFSVDKRSAPRLTVDIQAVCGLQDASYSQTIKEIARAGEVPEEIFRAGEEKLRELLLSVFEKSKKSRCDIFRAVDKLKKYETKYFHAYKEDLLDRVLFDAKVKFVSQR